MRIFFHRKFKKQVSKLRKADKGRLDERLKLFVSHRSHPLLHDHQLTGSMSAYRTINIGGDLRAQYIQNDEGDCFFLKIGTHSELYE